MTSAGVATPAVSPMAISSTPASANRAATERNRSTGTTPSIGSPNETAIVTLVRLPPSRAAAMSSAASAFRASAVDPVFFPAYPSEP